MTCRLQCKSPYYCCQNWSVPHHKFNLYHHLPSIYHLEISCVLEYKSQTHPTNHLYCYNKGKMLILYHSNYWHQTTQRNVRQRGEPGESFVIIYSTPDLCKACNTQKLHVQKWEGLYNILRKIPQTIGILPGITYSDVLF